MPCFLLAVFYPAVVQAPVRLSRFLQDLRLFVRVLYVLVLTQDSWIFVRIMFARAMCGPVALPGLGQAVDIRSYRVGLGMLDFRAAAVYHNYVRPA